MKSNFNNNEINEEENFFSIDWRYFFKATIRKKWTILFITLIFAISSVFYSLSIKNTYTSTTILFPKAANSATSSLISQYGGLARMAGIDLPEGQSSNLERVEEKLKSFTFFEDYIYEDILIELYAGDYWDRDKDILILDKEIFDAEDNLWVREVEWPLESKPSPQEAHILFLNQVETEFESKTGKLTISIENIRPNTAKEWLELIINSLEKQNRIEKVSSAEATIEYLEKERNSTELVDLKNMISQLISEQIKTIAFAEVGSSSLFDKVQEPYAPLLKTGPNRPLICILGSFLGFFIGILYALISYFLNERKTQLKEYFNSVSN
tara:strand:- start:38345 stop:39319 length:975 start_codon:yes stop_codon:yes gene_type:complete